MTREEILNSIQTYFDIYELVDKTVYEQYGDRAWKFIDTDLLHVMLVIRVGIGKPIYANNWKTAKPTDIIFDERGLRTNICDIVMDKTNKGMLYLSGHVHGKALDFDVSGMDPEEVRKWILQYEDLLPCKVRLEHINTKTGKPITWVHLDTIWEAHNPKIYMFNI